MIPQKDAHVRISYDSLNHERYVELVRYLEEAGSVSHQHDARAMFEIERCDARGGNPPVYNIIISVQHPEMDDKKDEEENREGIHLALQGLMKILID